MPAIASDERSKWDSDLVPDSRVIHFWDEGSIVGRWFAQRAGYQVDVVWDIYFLFGPDARWEQIPEAIISEGNPVILSRERLQAALQPLL